MDKQKSKIGVIIGILVILLIVIGVIVAVLYFLTDIFKSEKTMFMEYLSQNIIVAKDIYSNVKEDDGLEGQIYQETFDVDVNFIKNIGTTLESADNIMTDMNIELINEINPNENYKSTALKIYDYEELLLNVEEIYDDDKIYFYNSNVTDTYLVGDSSIMEEKILSIENINELNLIPEYQEFINLLNSYSIEITTEEQEAITNKLYGVLNSNIPEENFSIQSDKVLTIDENDYLVNAYIASLTKEQMGNLYIAILNELKADPIILAKMDQISKKLKDTNSKPEDYELKEEYVVKINEMINKIKENNIGTDICTITLYETNGVIIQTEIITTTDETRITWINSDSTKGFEYVNLDLEKGNNIELSLMVSPEVKEIIFSEEENKKVSTINLKKEKVVRDNGFDEMITYEAKTPTDEIKLNINRKVDTLTELDKVENEKQLDINKMNETDLQELINQLNQLVANKDVELSKKIDMETVEDFAITIGYVENSESFENIGITEIEKNRFNSQFDILVGIDLKTERVLEIIQLASNNINGYEVESENELKLIVDRETSDSDSVATISTFIEDNKNDRYNIELTYDESSGLVNGILLIIVEEE